MSSPYRRPSSHALGDLPQREQLPRRSKSNSIANLAVHIANEKIPETELDGVSESESDADAVYEVEKILDSRWIPETVRAGCCCVCVKQSEDVVSPTRNLSSILLLG